MDMIGRSPNLSPNEHSWDKLKSVIPHRLPSLRNSRELIRGCNNISQGRVESLIEKFGTKILSCVFGCESEDSEYLTMKIEHFYFDTLSIVPPIKPGVIHQILRGMQKSFFTNRFKDAKGRRSSHRYNCNNHQTLLSSS
ncbi:hypothetical protein CAPTEDRAFT_211074 [Capitella teleta]|uniref:Uncharacterized protein n=1 Tax=Capitella teleta TaxID=283909 RepID=R7UPZ6_CAPTE|nr:hypothetical protein CAPTEDRAFT_211074 [Capitella teleta]|eukprot:ELU08178.1 hypothetical protein CAPTEDRAFT_211074 [Capitella teleta]